MIFDFTDVDLKIHVGFRTSTWIFEDISLVLKTRMYVRRSYCIMVHLASNSYVRMVSAKYSRILKIHVKLVEIEQNQVEI